MNLPIDGTCILIPKEYMFLIFVIPMCLSNIYEYKISVLTQLFVI